MLNTLVDYKPMRLNRRKSFGDLLGTISHGVSLKYNSVSRRSRKQAHKTFYCEPVNSYGTEKDNNYDRALMSRRAEMFPAFISQNERAHEKGPDTEVRRSLDRTVASKSVVHGTITLANRFKTLSAVRPRVF